MLDAKVFVTTYGKYNQGNAAGFWVSLADFDDYNDFIDHCLGLHADDFDAELFFTDFEGFPKVFYSESGINPAAWDYISLSDNEAAIYNAYIDVIGTDDRDVLDVLSEAQNALMGSYDSEADFTDEIISNAVDNGEISQHFSAYIDSDLYWNGELRHYFVFSNGFIFQNL